MRPLDDADLQYLLEFPNLAQVDLNCHHVKIGPNDGYTGPVREPKITDAAMQTLAKLPRLQRLIVLEAKLSDRGMDYLAKSQTLEALAIEQSDVSDKGLRRTRRSRA